MCDKISYRDAAKCQDCIINQYENPDLWCKNGCIKSELTPPPKPAYDLLMKKKRLHPDITMWFVGEKCKECGFDIYTDGKIEWCSECCIQNGKRGKHCSEGMGFITDLIR